MGLVGVGLWAQLVPVQGHCTLKPRLPAPTQPQQVPSLRRAPCVPPALPSPGHSPELVLVSGLWDPAGALSALLFLNCSLQKLISAIYTDYARSLKNLGFKQGAVLFASKAGAAGRDLLNELESPKQELTD